MNRIHEEKCDYCGKLEHYAKGFCRSCYARYNKKGTPEYYEHPTTSWYERNKERTLQNTKRWRLNNKEKYKEYCHNYHLENKEKIHEYKKTMVFKKQRKNIK